MKNIYSDSIKVTNFWISWWNHSIEIKTEMWYTYKTSQFSQKCFEILTLQIKNDKINEIKVKTNYTDNFTNSEEISDWLKSKIDYILNY